MWESGNQVVLVELLMQDPPSVDSDLNMTWYLPHEALPDLEIGHAPSVSATTEPVPTMPAALIPESAIVAPTPEQDESVESTATSTVNLDNVVLPPSLDKEVG